MPPSQLPPVTANSPTNSQFNKNSKNINRFKKSQKPLPNRSQTSSNYQLSNIVLTTSQAANRGIAAYSSSLYPEDDNATTSTIFFDRAPIDAAPPPSTPSSYHPSSHLTILPNPKIGAPHTHSWNDAFHSRCHFPTSDVVKREIADKKWSQALALKKMGRWIRITQQERMKLAPVKRTLQNLVKPGEITKWNAEIERTYLCDLCSLPCTLVEAACVYCNIVMHRRCLTSNLLDYYSKGNKTFVCGFCQQDVQQDLNWYQGSLQLLSQQAYETTNAMLLTRIMRGFLSRYRYKKQRLNIIKFQSILRRFVHRHKFNSYRRAVVRPFYLNVLSVRNMPIANADETTADPYVVVTVHSGANKEQVSRFDTCVQHGTLNCTWEAQDFLVQGCSGDVTLVFTILDDEEGATRDQFLGQCTVSISRNELWLYGGVFDVDLGEVQYSIRDGDHHHHKVVSDINYDCKIKPKGTLSIEIKPLSYLNSTCGLLNGPQVDLLKKSGGKGGAQQVNNSSVLKRTYWCVIASGDLFVFERYGAKNFIVAIPLSNTILTKPKNKSRKVFSYDSHQLDEKEFSLKSGDISSSHRQKFLLAAKSGKECRRWCEVIEYWIEKEKKRKGKRGGSRGGVL